MKRISLLLFATLFLALPCAAQDSRIAVLDTDAFSEPDTGITRLIKAVESVNKEFEARRREFLNKQRRLQQQYEQLSLLGPIPVDPRPMTPERKLAVREQSEALKRDFERQQKKLEDAFNRRMLEVTAPIFEDITKSLESFTKQRGITLLLNAGTVSCSVGDCSLKGLPDVTREFIAEYNRLNP